MTGTETAERELKKCRRNTKKAQRQAYVQKQVQEEEEEEEKDQTLLPPSTAPAQLEGIADVFFYSSQGDEKI